MTALAIAVTTAISAFAEDKATYEKLFFIQRSKNANEVHYDARLGKDGNLDSDKPVVGYWWNKAEDGSRSSISLMQRIAYGFDVDPNGDGTYTMKLKAFKDRPLMLLKGKDGHWHGQVTIGGKQAYLNKLYVATDESGMMPKVLYVDLHGTEVATGAAVTEHIVKN